MSGIVTATAIAGVGALGAGTVAAGLAGATGATILGASLAGAGAGFALGGAVNAARAKPAQASAAAPLAQVAQSENQALSARTQLLETAGGSSGSALTPGEISQNNNKSTIFGN